MGRGLRSHERRPDLAAQLRRPPLPAARARRRSHRPRADPDVAGSRRALRHRLPHGVHRARVFEGRRQGRGHARLLARDRPLRDLPLQGGDPRDRRRRQGVARHVELVGVHRRRHRDGVRRGRRADGRRVHAVPPDRHGVAALGARHSGHRRRARRRRHPQEQQGRALHVQLHLRALRAGDRRHRRGGRPLAEGRQDGASPARAPDARRGRARDHRRGQGRARLAARRRLPRHRFARPGRRHQAQAAVDVPPVHGARRGRHHQGGDGGRADAALLHGRHPRRLRHAEDEGPRTLRRGECAAGHARRQPPRRQLAQRSGRVREARGRRRGRVHQDARRRSRPCRRAGRRRPSARRPTS